MKTLRNGKGQIMGTLFMLVLRWTDPPPKEFHQMSKGFVVSETILNIDLQNVPNPL
jgi:hypothetical protein